MISGEIDVLAGNQTTSVVSGNLTVNGNLVVLGTSPTVSTVTFGAGPTIKGDFSNATAALRTSAQTSTLNGDTIFGVVPNGTSTTSRLGLYNANSPLNCGTLFVTMSSTIAAISSNHIGSGTTLPLQISVGSNSTVRLDVNGNLAVGLPSVATTATSGFLYVSSMAGAPTGSVSGSVNPGYVPMVVDTTDSKLYFNIGGTWKSVTLA